jgi:hypothetical protein
MFVMECHFCHIRLNNRKARLARTAKDVQPAGDDVDNPVSDRQRESALGPHDSPNVPGNA